MPSQSCKGKINRPYRLAEVKLSCTEISSWRSLAAFDGARAEIQSIVQVGRIRWDAPYQNIDLDDERFRSFDVAVNRRYSLAFELECMAMTKSSR
jgi:hypothetical protein